MVGSGAKVGVLLGAAVGADEAVGTGEADCVGLDAALVYVLQALRINNGMIQDSAAIRILYIPSLYREEDNFVTDP